MLLVVTLLGGGLVVITVGMFRLRAVGRARRAAALGIDAAELEAYEARAEAERQRQAQDAQHAAERARRAHQAAAQARRAQEEVRRRAISWAQWADRERNFLRPDFQEQYAVKYVRQILDEWGHQWFTEAQEVKNDDPLRSLLEQEFPDVLKVMDARLEVYRIAQGLDVAPPPEPPVEEPKPRLTAEERQARIERFRNRLVRKVDVKAMDFMAKRLRKYELEQAYAEELRKYGLEDEEFERELQRLRDELTILTEQDEEKPDDHQTV
jgi:hypothetical protein